MKILSTEKFNSYETPIILSKLGEVDEFIQYVPNDRTPLLTQVEKGNYAALFVGFEHQIDAEMMSKCPNLKVVATRTTGLDHIDLDFCKEKGIDVLSLRGEDEFLKGIVATAEYTFMNMMQLLRKDGHELKGKTISIIGLGRIGKMMLVYCRAFGMEVISNNVQYADIVSLHITADEENRNFMNREKFEQMKDGSYFLNSARPWLVDSDALKWALESGKLAGVWSDFPEHQAGKTKESLEKTEIFMAHKLCKHLS